MLRSVVLGVDSSTQSTKVLAVDVEDGTIRGEGRAPHSGADIQHPEEWWTALQQAVRQAVGPDLRVSGISVAGQQHGCVTLDARGEVVRPAPLWNNVAAAPDAERLNEQADFAAAVGSRLVASFTIAKLAHLARTAAADLARTAAVGLPHDWLNFRLTGELATDRGEASGSGWWSPGQGRDRRDLLALAVGAEAAERLRLPAVRGPEEPAGTLTAEAAATLGLPAGIPVGPGSGDNMATALGVGAAPTPSAAAMLSPVPGPTGMPAGRPSAVAAVAVSIPAGSSGPRTAGSRSRSAASGPTARVRRSRR